MIDYASFTHALFALDVIGNEALARIEAALKNSGSEVSTGAVAKALVANRVLTEYQAEAVTAGRSADLVYGEYLVLDQLGKGGMGQVFLARHRLLNSTVALKTLRFGAVSSLDDASKRFLREVRASARLKHPNIVQTIDAGEKDGRMFLVMEHIEGKNLEQLQKEKGPYSIHVALRILQQVAEGLQHAHSKGYVHRDIKPSNVIIAARGQAKVLDMGIVGFCLDLLDESDPDPQESLTGDGKGLGTPDYISPEQITNAHSVDARADVYSLGCTFYKMLTGHTMYAGAEIHRMLGHLEHPPPPISKHQAAPDCVERLYQKMVAKSPDERFQNMEELLEELENVAATLRFHDVSELSLPCVSTQHRHCQEVAFFPGAEYKHLLAASAERVTSVSFAYSYQDDHVTPVKMIEEFSIDAGALLASGLPAPSPIAFARSADAGRLIVLALDSGDLVYSSMAAAHSNSAESLEMGANRLDLPSEQASDLMQLIFGVDYAKRMWAGDSGIALGMPSDSGLSLEGDFDFDSPVSLERDYDLGAHPLDEDEDDPVMALEDPEAASNDFNLAPKESASLDQADSGSQEIRLEAGGAERKPGEPIAHLKSPPEIIPVRDGDHAESDPVDDGSDVTLAVEDGSDLTLAGYPHNEEDDDLETAVSDSGSTNLRRAMQIRDVVETGAPPHPTCFYLHAAKPNEIALGYQDGGVFVSHSNGRRGRMLRGLHGVVRAVGMSRNDLLIAGDDSGDVRIWSRHNYAVSRLVTRKGSGVTCLSVDEEHKAFCLGRENGSVEVWTYGLTIARGEPHKISALPIERLQFVPGSDRRVAAIAGSRLLVVDSMDGEVIEVWRAPGKLTAFSVVEHRKRLIFSAALEDGRLYLIAETHVNE